MSMDRNPDYKHLEDTYLHYGVCPLCGEHCQPECARSDDDCLEEFVICHDCDIIWTLWHEDPTDKRDDTENWRTYRISDIQDR